MQNIKKSINYYIRSLGFTEKNFFKSRFENIIIYRQALNYHFRNDLNLSYPKIAKLLNKHYSTIMQQYQFVKDNMFSNPEYKKQIENIIQDFTSKDYYNIEKEKIDLDVVLKISYKRTGATKKNYIYRCIREFNSIEFDKYDNKQIYQFLAVLKEFKTWIN